MELLVVIAIIGILATVVLVSLNSARDKGKVAAALSQMENIERAVQLLHADTGLYPSGAIDASDLCFDPGGSNEIAADDPDASLSANGQVYLAGVVRI